MYYIYKITNLINGKTYIGQHKYTKLNDNYMGSGILIKQAIKKYGKENFKKEILEKDIPTVELANDFEQMYILFERAKGKAEYNIAGGGFGFGAYTEEMKKRMRHSHKPLSEETKKRMSESKKGENHWNYGKQMPEEIKQKLRETNIGNKYHLNKKHTDLTKQKISKANKGKEPYMKGKHHSEETKKILSEIAKGHIPWNKGLKGAQVGWNKGLKGAFCHSEESRNKISKNSNTPKVATAYKEYKLNGGTLTWNEFQKEYKNMIGGNNG